MPGERRVHEIFKHVGARVRQAREEAGLEQAELAARLGISPQQMNRIEQGRSGTVLPTLDRIARITGKPLAFFVDWSNDEEKDDKTANEGAPTLEDLRKMALMVEAAGGVDAAMARWVREVLEAANRGKEGIDSRNGLKEAADEPDGRE